MDSFQHRPPTGEISLYIHVPFCVRICPYCTFYHEPYRLADEQAYVEAVTREIRSALYSRTGRAALRTVYFGGGSPSRLAPESLRRLVESYTPCLVGKPDEIEQTIELNPEDVTADLLACLGEIGINRASLGIQSLESESQMWLGRCGPELNLRAIELVREGFANINLDLLVGIPGRTPGRLVGSLDQVMFFAPEHLSVYCLEAAGDGPSDVRTFLAGVDPDHSAREYLAVCEFLRQRGYRHYEVSNFARPGYESRHNRAYWTGVEYIGVGPGAHSYRRRRRYHNVPSLPDYLKCMSVGPTPPRIVDRQRASQRQLERMMLALRTDEGLPLDWIEIKPTVIEGVIDEGLGSINGGRLSLTDRGFLLLDEILLRLIPVTDDPPPRRTTRARKLDKPQSSG